VTVRTPIVTRIECYGICQLYSHKPRWRPDGYGFGEPIPTWGPIIAFRDEMIAMAIAWNGHTRSMICDLIARLHELDENSEARVWNLVETFARHGTDEDKAELREKIRVTVMSRRGVMLSKRGSKSPAGLTAAAKAAYAALEPSDLINKHAWLFRDGWVDESADEIEDEGFDVEKREQGITKLRINAIGEVLVARGIEGINAAMAVKIRRNGRLLLMTLETLLSVGTSF
jgi:hypothetical protein